MLKVFGPGTKRTKTFRLPVVPYLDTVKRFVKKKLIEK